MKTNTPTTLHIDMVSDVVCPWCAIGYQRLQQALRDAQQEFPEVEITLNFQPFELNPDMSPGGQNLNEHFTEKLGYDEAKINQGRERLHAIGETEGVTFNTDNESRVYNTFLAHKLLLAAEGIDSHGDLKEELFHAYFRDQKNISSEEVLLDIASNVGISRESARSALEDKTLAQQVRDKEDHYIRMGVSSVPTLVINNQYMVSGAQDASELGNVIRGIITNTGNM